MDNYVPTDDDATECTSIVSALTSSTREDLGMLFVAVSYKMGISDN